VEMSLCCNLVHWWFAWCLLCRVLVLPVGDYLTGFFRPLKTAGSCHSFVRMLNYLAMLSECLEKAPPGVGLYILLQGVAL